MSKITVIVEDKTVIINGVLKQPLDFTIDSTIHAVQWYDTWGEIEYVTTREGKPQNEQFEDISLLQSAIDAWTSYVSIVNPSANTTI